MTQYLIESVRGIPVEWQVFFLSMLPVTELRAAIPIGIAQGLPVYSALIFGVMGNWVPVLPLLLLLEPVSGWLSKFDIFQRPLEWVFSRTRAKSDKVKRYGAWGLLLFVGVPAPGTGVWTGSLLAFLLGIGFWRALWPILAGAVLAGLLVSLATVGALKLLAGELGLILLILVVLLLALKYRRK